MLVNQGQCEGRILERRQPDGKDTLYLTVAWDLGSDNQAQFYLPKHLTAHCPALGEDCIVTYRLKNRPVAKTGRTGAYGANQTEIEVIDVQPKLVKTERTPKVA